MSDDIKTGIKACLYKNPNKKGELILLNPQSVIYLVAGKTHEFFLTDRDEVLGINTKNRTETINNAKWAFLLAYYWKEAKETEKGKELPLWANLGGSRENVQELGIGNQYKLGSSIKITPTSNDVWIGYFYRMEVFNYTPGIGMNFDFMVLDKPKIRMGYFDKQNLKPEAKEFSINDGYYSYGEVIKLYVNTHLLPMKIDEFYHKNYGKIESEESFKDLKIEVHLTDENGVTLLDKPVISGDLQDFLTAEHKTTSNNTTSTAANLEFEIPILINSEWKDKIHTKSERVKHYSVFIVIENTDTGKRYEYSPDMSSITRIAKSNRDFESKEVDYKFSVKYESMDTILGNMETKKNNMIQYIGDIEYNRKENNPCAYSVITVNNGDKDIEIFNEYKLDKKVDDETSRFIDIVTGDKDKKEVKVTAKFLKNKDAKPEAVRTIKNGHLCEKILNDGKTHNGIHDVFKMDWIVGQWVPSKDPNLFFERYKKSLGVANFYHPSNGSSSPKIEWNKSDQEAKGIESPNKEQYETVTVAGIQGLTNEDYNIDEGNDSITLKLQYKYNKSYDDKILNYLYGEQSYLKGGIFSENYKNLWVVRYLLKWVKNEPLEQLYFVPVTTCRYPNQIAQIRIFPDMKWVLNFNYNIETPLYYKANTPLAEYYSGFNEGKINTSNNNERKKILNKSISNDLQHFAGRKTSFGLYVECEVSGEDDVIKLGDDFAEKYRNMCAPLFWMVNKLDGDLGVSDAKEEKVKLLSSPSTKKGLWARLNKMPMEFELSPPSIGVGLGIGYASSQNGKINYELDGTLIADPIIGASVKLDILALGSKFKPWGAIIDALDLVSWLTNLFSGGSVEINYELYFQLTAKINLVGTDSKDGETKPASITYNFEDKKFKGNIALQGYLEGKFVMSASFQYKVLIEKGKQVSLKEDEEKRRKAFEMGIWVEGKAIVTLTIGKNFGEKDDWDADFYFSGVTLDIKIKAGGFDKEENDLKITPRVDKKINIFKDVGEVK